MAVKDGTNFQEQKHVLVTGAQGFIGRALCRYLVRCGQKVTGIVRRPPDQSFDFGADFTCTHVPDIGPQTNWAPLLHGVTDIVHLAGLSSVAKDQQGEARRVNVEGSQTLARAAARGGVQRLVFQSSAKVHGEGSVRAYCETDPPKPEDIYAETKWQAEQLIRAVCEDSKLQVSILRPPLVYGAGVQGNVAALGGLVARGLPLPFGSLIKNKRAMIGLANLLDAIWLCLVHPSASGKTYLVADDESPSTAQLIQEIAAAQGQQARLFPMPVFVFETALRLLKREKIAASLTGSFEVNSSLIRADLGWAPKQKLSVGLAETFKR